LNNGTTTESLVTLVSHNVLYVITSLNVTLSSYWLGPLYPSNVVCELTCGCVCCYAQSAEKAYGGRLLAVGSGERDEVVVDAVDMDEAILKPLQVYYTFV
jgi:hypothetical protein